MRIIYPRPTYFDSKGRNGFLRTTGIAVTDIGKIDPDDPAGEIQLRPVNSRGEVSEACQIALRKEAIPRLIEVLQAYTKATLKERLLAERALLQKWLSEPMPGEEPGDYEREIEHIDWRLSQSDIADPATRTGSVG